MVILSYIFYLTFLSISSLLSSVNCYFHHPATIQNVWTSYSFAHHPKMPDFSPKEWVDGLVKKHKVVVFSKSYCPYCTRAKNALEGLKLKDVHVEELDSHPEMDKVQDYLGELTGARSVPRVFVNGSFYGDSSKTVADVESGSFMKQFGSHEL